MHDSTDYLTFFVIWLFVFFFSFLVFCFLRAIWVLLCIWINFWNFVHEASKTVCSWLLLLLLLILKFQAGTARIPTKLVYLILFNLTAFSVGTISFYEYHYYFHFCLHFLKWNTLKSTIHNQKSIILFFKLISNN